MIFHTESVKNYSALAGRECLFEPDGDYFPVKLNFFFTVRKTRESGAWGAPLSARVEDAGIKSGLHA
jgi:hypothetical protein